VGGNYVLKIKRLNLGFKGILSPKIIFGYVGNMLIADYKNIFAFFTSP